ncbi:hypothetical protein Nepgr_030789 [Nepenthes gracilis]|uniref:Uncharacterized protein n=1 Tax=Nepenthes gracilis TaxID=150966 RepID=A0AAD3TGW6_NEPGR|nr:hypothetical protein Nepgr_030789 [Nepenthes gracilis]
MCNHGQADVSVICISELLVDNSSSVVCTTKGILKGYSPKQGNAYLKQYASPRHHVQSQKAQIFLASSMQSAPSEASRPSAYTLAKRLPA